MPFSGGNISGQSVSTIQLLNATGSVTSWGSIVEIGNTPLTSNIVITLPQCINNIGKEITFKRIDNTAFTVSVSAFAGDTSEITTLSGINGQYGALTLVCVSTTKSEQVNNIGSTSVVGDYSGIEQHSVNNSTNLTTVTSTNSNLFGTLLTTSSRYPLTGATIQGGMVVNTTNGTITVAKSGTYNIVVSVTIQSAGANGQWGQLVKNNTTILNLNSAYSQVSSASMQIVFNYTGEFVVGDFVDIRLSASSAGTIGVMGYSYSMIQSSGFIPVSGQTVDYGFYKPTTGTWANSNGFDLTLIEGNLTITSLTGRTGQGILLKAGKTYDLSASLMSETATNNEQVRWYINTVGASDTIIPNAPQSFNANFNTTGTQLSSPITSMVYTPVLDTIVYLRDQSGNADTLNTNRTWVKIKQIGTTAYTSTGQTVDTVSVNLTGSNQSVPAVNTDVIFNTLAEGSIPYNTTTGVFSLTAFKKYELECTLKSRSATGGYIQYEWVDAVTNVAITGGINGVDMQVTSTLSEGSSSRAYLLFTPTTDQTVKVRVTGVSGTTIQLDAQRCNANIKQLGSSSVITSNNVAEFGEQILGSLGSSASFTAIPNGTITIPSAGVWEIGYNIYYIPTEINESVQYRVIKTSDSSVVTGSLAAVANAAVSGHIDQSTSQRFTVTTTGSAQYTIQGLSVGSGTEVVWSSGTSIANSKIYYQKISGFNITSGQSVDYKTVSAWNTSAVITATDVVFTSIGEGNIPYSAGLFTLSAGKTYEIKAHIEGTLTANTGTDWVQFILCNSLNAQLANSPTAVITGTAQTNNWQNSSDISTIYTPTATTQVKLRLNNRGTSASFSTNTGLQGGIGCWMSVTQLGASAFSTFTSSNGITISGNNISTTNNDQTASGYFDIGNMRMQWGQATTGASTVNVNMSVPFLNTSYVVTLTPRGVSGFVESASSQINTTSQFAFNGMYQNGGTPAFNNGRVYSWIAIGQKP